MIKVGVTGNNGFIGQHLCRNLQLLADEFELIDFKREYFDNPKALTTFVQSCDVIIHLAGINRHDDIQLLHDTNISITEKLVTACESVQAKPKIIFSSSSQQTEDNLYGKSKKASSDLICNWSLDNVSASTIMIIPNVFGPFGKPYYNSVISTFCYELVNGKNPTIQIDKDVRFIYVDELVEIILEEVRNTTISNVLEICHTEQCKVSEILNVLELFKETYFLKKSIPTLTNAFQLNLFNTFRSYISHKNFFPIKLTKHEDDRGAFVEIVRVGTGGQVSFSTTHPSIVRGNHFHKRKIERFAVIKGEALIQLRKYNDDEIMEFYLNGDTPSFVDMPVWFTHNIKNIGAETLYTIFWINEAYNPENPDTYFEQV
jgi:UDP-2-acetamido-2,6-beta-L-arabino-hexul-4-ose reductase